MPVHVAFCGRVFTTGERAFETDIPTSTEREANVCCCCCVCACACARKGLPGKPIDNKVSLCGDVLVCEFGVRGCEFVCVVCCVCVRGVCPCVSVSILNETPDKGRGTPGVCACVCVCTCVCVVCGADSAVS